SPRLSLDDRLAAVAADDAVGQAGKRGAHDRQQLRRRVRVDLGLSALDAAHDGARDLLGRLARARALHLEALLARHRVAELGLGADREHDADAYGRARELDAQALRQSD